MTLYGENRVIKSTYLPTKLNVWFSAWGEIVKKWSDKDRIQISPQQQID